MPASDEDSFEAPRPGLDAKGRGSPQVPQKRAESGLGESQRLQLVGDTRAPFGFSEGKERQISHSRVGRIIPSTIQRLAERIINAQQDEIATMQQWLRDRLQPVPDASAMAMKMDMPGMHHEMLMPGMLTEAQMKQLDDARGKEFDRLFLTFMIQHHNGALTMVKDLFDSYGAGQDETVFKFASDVNVDQTTEIARMQRMLDALP